MRVLFVCKGNVARSQMAEAFFNKFSKKNKAISAGADPGVHLGNAVGEYKELARCMKDIGLDISHKKSKQLTKEMVEKVDKVISLVDKRLLPDYVKKSKKLEIYFVEDPDGKDYEFHCKVRDQIKDYVKKLVKKFG